MLILSRDITDANVLLQADDDDIESAALIDWDTSSFPPDGEWDDDVVSIDPLLLFKVLCAHYFLGREFPGRYRRSSQSRVRKIPRPMNTFTAGQ